MTTIKDVARLAGVSVATVSHVMNDSRAVGVQTRERVKKAIETLRYRRDGVARSLRMSQTGTIAVLVSDITNPFFSELVRGVENAVQRRHETCNILLCNTEENADRERRTLDLVLEKRIDGIIMAPAGGNEAYLAELMTGDVPIVFADRTLPGVSADAVVVNNREAAARLTEHLIGLGHTRIAALRAELKASSIDERLEGFLAAMGKAKLAVDSDVMVSAPSSIEDAMATASRLLALRQLPTAVFCTNNFMTLGVIRALLDGGLRCPDDLAVVGFDDFPWAASFRPRLTVVAQPAQAMGEEAASLLFDRIAKRRTGPAIRVVLDTTLVVRESCGAAAAAVTAA